MSGEEPRTETGGAMVLIGLLAGALFLFATNALNRLQVHLDREGLTVAKLWTVRRYRWDEVSDFTVSGRGSARGAKLSYVVFNADRGTGIGRAMNRFLTGKTQILPVGLVFEDGSGDAIIVADVTMSLDNVLAVAGAAHDAPGMLVFGLVLSILLMAFAANWVASLLERHKWLAYAGLAVVAYVALEMIWRGSHQVMAATAGML